MLYMYVTRIRKDTTSNAFIKEHTVYLVILGKNLFTGNVVSDEVE